MKQQLPTLLSLVQEALATESKLENCLDNIYILVNDGAVIIAGSVTQESLRALIKGIVSSVHGVNLVINDLKIEPAAARRLRVQIDWAKESMALV